MKLKSFEIKNYRCIEDSGEVQIRDYAVLVGKNESGKTACLKALHKFNPVHPEPFDGLREFPRRRYHEFGGNEPVATLTLELSKEEIEHLAKIDAHFSKIQYVKITKGYASTFDFEFVDIGRVPPLTKTSSFFPEINNAFRSITDFSGIPDAETFKSAVENAIGKIGSGVDDLANLRDPKPREIITQQIQAFQSLASDGQKQAKLKPVLEVVSKFLGAINTDPDPQARDYLLSSIPRFIYFESYAVIDSRIHLPSFVQKLKSGALSPDERTARTLFKMVNLDPELLVKLGAKEGKSPEQIQKDIDERAIRVSRASVNMTGDLVKIWEQRENRVDFYLDGEYMRLWVTDNVDGSKIELEQRGKGFQWFLSFYIVFNVESEEGHKEAILLLDDPGLYLHASAQANLVRVLRRLSKKNQLIYTTHSPFMIDMEDLDTIHTVTESRETGTKISDRMWATDKEALFPLQTALGYSISQSLFVARNNLVVEGITDYWILSTLSMMFREAGLESIDESLVISPAGGAHKAGLLAAMYAGQKLNTVVLLDSDKEGKSARDELVKSKIIKDTNVIFISEAVPYPEDEMELEDVFPEDFYLKYVNKTYYKELDGKELTAPLSSKSPLIRRRLEEEFGKFNVRFHKSRPARLMLDEFPRMKPNDLPKEFVERVERLFGLINVRKAS